MLQAIDSYDWGEAFAYVGDPGTVDRGDEDDGYVWTAYGYESDNVPERIPGQQDDVSNAPCLRKDVVEILGIAEGEKDGPEWLLLAKMRDGRYLSLEAGCDYTGWD